MPPCGAQCRNFKQQILSQCMGVFSSFCYLGDGSNQRQKFCVSFVFLGTKISGFCIEIQMKNSHTRLKTHEVRWLFVMTTHHSCKIRRKPILTEWRTTFQEILVHLVSIHSMAKQKHGGHGYSLSLLCLWEKQAVTTGTVVLRTRSLLPLLNVLIYLRGERR